MLGAHAVDDVPSGPRTRRRDTLLFAGQSLLLAGAVTGAVLGKIMLLVLLILFIQWRPQGMFAPKGRAAAEL